MPNFLKLLRRRPLSEKGTIEKKVEEVTTFINRELLPFLQEFRDSTQSSDDENDEDIEAIQNEPFVTTAASTTLTNESVATNSTEIQPSFGAGIITWSINTASVVFAKLQNLTGLSVLGRATNSSGVMAAITSTAAYQALRSNSTGTSVGWESYLPTAHIPASISGLQNPYLLPVGFAHGDTLRLTITADTTIRAILDSTSSRDTLPEGFEFNLCLSDQSGGAAPGWFLDIEDTVAVTGLEGFFRTPGQVQGTSPGPSYRMRSEEEGTRVAMQFGNWRIISGTAAQAITGAVTVASGNGSTRTSIFSGIRDNGSLETARGFINFRDSTSLSAFVVQDAGNDELEVTFGRNALTGDVTAAFDSGVTAIAAGVIVNADINASAAIALSKLATQAAETFVGNFTAGVAVPTALAGSTVAGAGITYSTGGILAVGAGTGVTVNANDVAVTIPLTDGDKGDITVSSSGTVFSIDAGVIVDADVNAAAAIAQTKLGAFTGVVEKASGASTTTFGAPAPVSITGGTTVATIQDQVDSIVSALVSLGLATDNR